MLAVMPSAGIVWVGVVVCLMPPSLGMSFVALMLTRGPARPDWPVALFSLLSMALTALPFLAIREELYLGWPLLMPMLMSAVAFWRCCRAIFDPSTPE